MWQEKGFVEDNADLVSSITDLENIIEEVPARFRKLSDEHILRRPAPGKWSKKEILGHLVDSALNNLKRFTEIPFLPQPYIVQSYNQVELVKANHYQEIPLDQLINVWQALNRQIVFVVKNIPAEKLVYPVNPQYDNNEMKTLEWIIMDYVAHLHHHLRQIFA
ncbi:MAG: metal-dependent hydrolase [Bacteroidetes bacterium]|nr:MAG: metal-dependent hydrolase [Bacteroidota bacterium]